MRFWIGLFLVTSLGIAAPAWAYTDRVDASAQEIYDAAIKSFEKQGLSQSDPQKKTLTTKWMHSRIRRARQRRFVPLELKENVDFRYQMEVEIKEGKAYSEVSVHGRFEEKPTGAPPQQSWKQSYSSKELYFKEREFFFNILNTLEIQKKAAASTPAPSA